MAVSMLWREGGKIYLTEADGILWRVMEQEDEIRAD